MKKLFTPLCAIFLCACLWGCASSPPPAQIAATTLPVYEFTVRLCVNTPITVTQLVTEEVSCLHDYSLNVNQVRSAESAEVVIISGAGLEEAFLCDMLHSADIIDASRNIELICPEEDHSHSHEESNHSHHHDQDPHIWLSPENAMTMAANICAGLSDQYPQHYAQFQKNLDSLIQDLIQLKEYGDSAMEDLSCRELITFHDGFSYFAHAFQLTILEAVEEESGSEASAQELIHLIEEVSEHHLPAIFIEKNGSDSAASIIARETGIEVFSLDMAMSGSSYFDSMYHNINVVKEALQ